jgi:methionine-rich copper-binding protein CopC
LLWSPDITTDQEGNTKIEFYTSDRAGKYMVLLQGMSADGDCVSAQTFFEVK